MFGTFKEDKQRDFILLDRSGSMGGAMWKEALSAINTYVHKLRDDKVPTKVTLALFDTGSDGNLDFTILRKDCPPKAWEALTDDDAKPRGGTPLNDAVGKIVQLANEEKPDKAAIIIMTDGQENASREVKVEQAKSMLEDCRKKGWVVTFLGANFDNVQQAAIYGSGVNNTISSSLRNMTGTMSAMAGKRSLYGSTGQAATMDWSDDEREEAKK